MQSYQSIEDNREEGPIGGNIECLIHYTDQFLQIRKDFLDICAYDKNQYDHKSGKSKYEEPNQECMAKILRLFETITTVQKAQWYLKETMKAKRYQRKEPGEYRLKLSYSSIAHLLYDTFGEATIRKSIRCLVEKSFIQRHRGSNTSIPMYVLNISVVQQALQQHYEDDITEELKQREGKALRVAGFACQVCQSPNDLKVSPCKMYPQLTTYEHLGNLVVICECCRRVFQSPSVHTGRESHKKEFPPEMLLRRPADTAASNGGMARIRAKIFQSVQMS